MKHGFPFQLHKCQQNEGNIFLIAATVNDIDTSSNVRCLGHWKALQGKWLPIIVDLDVLKDTTDFSLTGFLKKQKSGSGVWIIKLKPEYVSKQGEHENILSKYVFWVHKNWPQFRSVIFSLDFLPLLLLWVWFLTLFHVSVLLYFYFSSELCAKSVMVTWLVALIGLVQSNCKMKELVKHGYCYSIIKINLRNVNFERKDLATDNVQQKNSRD